MQRSLRVQRASMKLTIGDCCVTARGFPSSTPSFSYIRLPAVAFNMYHEQKPSHHFYAVKSVIGAAERDAETMPRY